MKRKQILWVAFSLFGLVLFYGVFAVVGKFSHSPSSHGSIEPKEEGKQPDGGEKGAVVSTRKGLPVESVIPGPSSTLTQGGSGLKPNTSPVVEGQESPTEVPLEAGGGTGLGESTTPTVPDGDETHDRSHFTEVANILDEPLDLSDPAIRAEIALKVRALEDAEVAATIARAKQLGIPLFIADDDGPGASLSHFEGDRPVYVGSNNLAAAISTNASRVRSTAPFNVDGTGHVIGLWEAHERDSLGNLYGHPRSTHQEFGVPSKIRVRDTSTRVSSHATHVAGTLAGLGINSSARGMAPGAIVDAYDAKNDVSEMLSAGAATSTESGKLRVSNHSYGYVHGWMWNRGWTEWYGGFSDDGNPGNDLPAFGVYSSYPRSIDAMLSNLPYYLPFIAAGNDKNNGPPDSGATWFLNGNRSRPFSYNPSRHPRGDGSYRNGFDLLPDMQVAKNAITVGAVADAVTSGQRDVLKATLTSFSSTGPTDDGRIKPDIVANGVGLTSAGVDADFSYSDESGTSMATPNAAGSALLLVDLYGKRFGGGAMRSSTLKGLIIHTADDRGNPGPDYQYGWGLMNTLAAANLIVAHADRPDAQRIIEGEITSASKSRSYQITWDGSSPLRATLCWTDPAGPAQTSNDVRTRTLVNDLNVRMNAPSGATHRPFVMPYVGNWGSATLSATATRGVNSVDNVEQVLIDSPSESGRYTITVDHAGTLTNGRQPFSLIISGVTNPTRAINLTGSMSFGSVTVGQSATRTLTVRNTGNAPLSVTGISLPSRFTANPSVFDVEPGDARSVSITFSPTATQAYTGNLSVTSNASSGSGVLAVSGTGSPQQTRILFLSEELNFGNVPLGHSAVRTLIARNDGSGPLNVTSISFPTGFSSSWTGGVIPAGEYRFVPVTFSPTQIRSYSGDVVFNSDATSGSNRKPATGTGVAAPTITSVSNNSPVTGLAGAEDSLRYYRFDVADGRPFLTFEISGGSGDCDMYVRRGNLPSFTDWDFYMGSAGSDEKIEIDNASSGTYYVMLHGFTSYSGVALRCRSAGLTDLPTVTTATPNTITQSSARVGGNVSATGSGGSVSARGVQIAESGDFSSESTVSLPLGSGLGSFEDYIPALRPSTNYYARAYAENGLGRAYGEPIAFSTQAISRTISVSGGLSFGDVNIGENKTLNLTIGNTGNSTLRVTSLVFPSGFSGNWAGGYLGPGETQVVSVTFSPISAQVYGGTFSVGSNATGSVGNYSISGRGTVAPTRIMSVSGDLDFGLVRIGRTVSRSMTLRNTGNSALTVTGFSLPQGFSVTWSGLLAPGETRIVQVTFLPVTSGDYRGELTINSNATSGSAELPISGAGVGDDHSEDLNSATLISRGESSHGNVDSPGDVDVFRIEVPEAGTIVLGSLGGSDVVGELLDAGGNVLESDDDGGGGGNFLIRARIRSGTYYIRVRHANPAGVGYYQISYEIEDRRVVAWGWDIDGQTSVPVDLKNPVAIAAGQTHTVALNQDGTVNAWGNNEYGQTDTPLGLTGVVAISAENHTVALKADGTVVAWGNNEYGQCNVPAGLTGVKAIAAGGLYTVALKVDGTVVQWGAVNQYFAVPAGLSQVVAIAAGAEHTVALKSDGTVVSWGYYGSGQTDVPQGLTDVVAIAAGGYFTTVLKRDGSVLAWGENGNGQVDVPAGLRDVVKLEAGAWHVVATKRNGEVVTWGKSDFGMGSPPNDFGEVISVDAGRYHSVAVVRGGQGQGTGSSRIAVTVGARRLPNYGGALQFVEEVAGNKGHSVTLRISNIGTAAVAGLRVTVSRARRPDFVITRFPSQVIAVGGSTSFTVRFRPTARGIRKAFVFVRQGDASASLSQIRLIGRGK